MIRINLLYPRTRPQKRLQGLLPPGGRSAIVSRRELLLGVILLAAGGAMLHIYLGVFDTRVPENERTGGNQATLSPANADATPQNEGGDQGRDTELPVEAQPSSPPPALPRNGRQPGSVVEKAKAEKPPEPAPKPPPVRHAPGPAPGAAKLRDVRISVQTGSLRMSLDIGKRPTYKTFRLKAPRRVVVDIPDVWVMVPREQLHREVDHPLVSRIRVGQFKGDPPIARIVLDVVEFPNLLLFPHSGGLDIHVSSTTE